MKQLKITLTMVMVAVLLGTSSPTFAQNGATNDANRPAMNEDRDDDHNNWGLLGLLGLVGLAGLRKTDKTRAYTTSNTGGNPGRTGV